MLGKVGFTDEKVLYAYIGSFFVDDYNQRFAPNAVSLSGILPPVLAERLQWQIHEEFIKPIFIDLKKFDYSNPNEWLESWFNTNFPPEKKKKN